MLDLSKEGVWKRLLEEDSELKELAIKAGVEDNPKRAQELNGCYAWNCGSGVVKSEEERTLARYLFCCDFEGNGLRNTLIGRMIAAREAGETEL